MTDDSLLEIHEAALGGMPKRPRMFARLAQDAADEDFPNADLSDETFLKRLATEGDPLRALWTRYVTAWDFAEDASWSQHPPRTPGRRADAYARLCFDYGVRDALDDIVPLPLSSPQSIVKITNDEGFVPWYTRENASARSFYWSAYERYLRETKNWSEDAIATLDEASHSVVERLADPTRPDEYGARGLVVGYVQSGKTANFTGVTAKAMDAGYRLVIVLGGTLNLLRNQTQRRLDMELVGQENIRRGVAPTDLDALIGIDYQDDEDWPQKFVSHGNRPSYLNSFNIERLTKRDGDYKSLEQGIRTLEPEKRDRRLPLYAPENLHHADARLMVVKKNKSVLTKLVKDLKQIGNAILSEIPVLIIDDESDQASVNTTNPTKRKSGEVTRTAINGLISQLLTLLPRAQYVGYTATPFANVFTDPGDEEDIFPRDFLISLPRPKGYMGVQEFHDLDSPVPVDERTVANSQEKAHVRGIYDKDTDGRLQEAMDAFILSGALKLYREDHDVPAGPFRHHTMLVHESVRMDDHSMLALRINSMWHQAGYTSATGHLRLADLLESDFRKVSEAQGATPDGTPLPFPDTYDDLKPYVFAARQRINEGGDPVVVVNGDTDRFFAQMPLDFDRTPHVWKILVGGTKLSRGFTVEGLTVTYYRRTTQQADTLMQMGRWFGFRPNYQDLVRLYIGREEAFGRSGKKVDLYEAFEAICQDEEDFRAELDRYSVLVDGKPQVTPEQVRPLVSQHLPWVRPSARNKMYNAELLEIRSPGQPIEPRFYPREGAAIGRNTERWRSVLDALSGPTTACQLLPSPTNPLARTFLASTALVPHAELLGVLSGLDWEDEGTFMAPHLAYLSQLDGKLAKVDDWLVITPHLTSGYHVEAQLHGQPLPLHRRTRDDKKPFNRIASADHRMYAQQLTDAATQGTPLDSSLSVGPHRGVALLYPVIEAPTHDALKQIAASGTVNPSQTIMAFTLTPPRSAIDSKRKLLRYRTMDSRQG
ncbi:Z1 domain-containing protein [Streptomyces sp. NPDC087440]|uniref:Z1 domain-containing protein n=1 Tax=Streptomyces sp. NPDC087440 TaxID=3365790 RepID=UPI0037F55494